MSLLSLTDLDRGPGALLLRATISQGYSEPVARAGLRAELDAWQAEGATDAVLAELEGVDPARHPRRVLIIAARTVPASTLRAVLMARLLGARVLLKAASGQEVIAEVIARADPEVAARPFAGSDPVALQSAIAEADTIVVLGSDATIASVRAQAPADKAFVGYGHRVSAVWLSEIDEDAVEGIAADLCAWDQSGCLSPQVVWTPEPARLLDPLASVLEARERHLPQAIPAEAHLGRLVARARAEMLGRCRSTDTAVVASLPSGDFRSSPGWRFLWVLPRSEAALAATLPILSTLATNDPHPPALPGHVRVCRPGEMQQPPLTWRHDGMPNLLPLLRPARSKRP